MQKNIEICPDSKIHGTYEGPIWGRHDPGGPHAGPMILAMWVMKHIPTSELGHNWMWWWLGTCLVPSYYLNQQWLIANWTIKNKHL